MRAKKKILWVCHAIPALTGKACGHANTKGIKGHDGLLCCEECGCTKRASDYRARGLGPQPSKSRR